jgi:methyl-accepting chemotaxis protein
MTIAKRLLILISASVACVLIVGLYALSQLKVVGDNGDYLAVNTIPSYENLYTTMIELQEVRALTFKHILYDDPTTMAEVEQQINKSKKIVVQNLDAYGKNLLTNDEDKKLWSAADNDSKAYLAIVDTVLQYSRSGHKAEARDYLTSHLPLVRKARQDVEEDIKFNHRVADDFNKTAQQEFARALLIVSLLILAAVVLSAWMGWRIYHNVVGPLNSLKQTVAGIEHDLDLTRKAPVVNQDEVGETVTAFNKLVAKLQDTLGKIRQHAASVNESAGGLATAASQVSISSVQQSESTSNMAATVEQMTVGIGHMADRTNEANQLAEKSGKLAKSGEQVISETVADIHKIAETMREASEEIRQLEANSEQISAVIAVIREVAEQTNLLALNAAIEAARAGEQGRGFAVVADEVRKLAERTSQSTEEISLSISAMQASAQRAVSGTQTVAKHVDNGVGRANEANRAMQEIGTSALQTVQMVSEISLAMREQSSASTSIAQQVERIAQMTEENSAAAQATADTANQLDELAATMQSIIAQFRIS